MTHSSDEFGESLEEMFPDLDDSPSLEMAGNFGQGSLIRKTPRYTDTHLCAMFLDLKCTSCGTHSLAPQHYAVRRISHTRSQCISYEKILPHELTQYDHLPHYKYHYQMIAPFCGECLSPAYERTEKGLDE